MSAFVIKCQLKCEKTYFIIKIEIVPIEVFPQ
nr:MAG TPA: hypothetical protein [Caudoviricetes sp.]DAP01688.1 MAG TPA: hypothetical protein [Caudoviricetes sp.]DAR30106.1 MAG TPA: hypothetical protein [Caudoviricetes sp.]